MNDKPLVKINGGFPPIKENKPIKTDKNYKDKSLSKERGFTSSSLKTVKISDIMKAKKEDIIKNDNVELQIVDSL